MIDERAVPSLSPGVRLREDKARGGWVLLAPERLFVLDEHALAVLQLVDGKRRVIDIVATLATRYEAAREVVMADAAELLQELVDRGSVRL